MKHIVGFSGGIDSERALLEVLKHQDPADVIATNSSAGGWEDPLTVEFIEHFSETVFPITVIPALIKDMWETPGWAEGRGYDSDAELTYELMIEIKGRPPSRKAQFCTSILKLRPQRRWIKWAFGPTGPYAGEEYVRYTGVRRDESEPRKDTPFEQWDEWYDCMLYAPIADLNKQQCFDDVLEAGWPINPLYAMGFERVGCAPCINCNKEDIVMWNLKRPEMIEKVRQVEKRTGRTFFSPCVPGKTINSIDEVLEWAMSLKRGGHSDQPAFPIFFERPSCESRYGLCE